MSGFSAWAATRTDSIRVRADESGVPSAIHIESDELRFGGEALAKTVLDLCERATASARAARRAQLERDGVEPDILDRLGLPSASSVAAEENERLDRDAAPVSWMKTV